MATKRKRQIQEENLAQFHYFDQDRVVRDVKRRRTDGDTITRSRKPFQERAIDVEPDHVAAGCMFLPPRDHKWRKSGRRASLPPRPVLTVVNIDIDSTAGGKNKQIPKNSAAPCAAKKSSSSSSSLTDSIRYSFRRRPSLGSLLRGGGLHNKENSRASSSGSLRRQPSTTSTGSNGSTGSAASSASSGADSSHSGDSASSLHSPRFQRAASIRKSASGLGFSSLSRKRLKVNSSGSAIQQHSVEHREPLKALPFAPLSSEKLNFTANATNATTPDKPWPPRMRRSISGIARKSLKNIRGSLRAKLSHNLQKNSMKGKADYSMPMVSGEMSFLQFMTAAEDKIPKPTRFSSKQPMRATMDMFRPPDEYLQQKIDHEIKMRDGTAKLLAASKRPQQLLEAAKNLLTSNTRMIGYMSELQRRKTDEVLKRRNSEDEDQVPCKARVCVSDFRIPLMWKDSDHFKNKGDHRRYAVFCLWRIGTEIHDTTLIKDVDRNMTDLCFDEVFVFNDVDPNFDCKLEVYCHKQLDDFTIASTPKKLKKRMNELSTSIGRSVGKRLSGLKDENEFMSNMLVGPKFEQIACATLRLKDTSSDVGTFDLTTLVANSTLPDGAAEVPLWGHYCVRVAAQPLCLTEDTVSGYLQLQDDSTAQWQRMYCVLKNLQLQCYDAEAESFSHPDVTIPVTKETQIYKTDPATCEKENTFLLSVVSGRRRVQHSLCAPSEHELRKWWNGLQQHMLDQVMWQHACEELMEMKEASALKSTSQVVQSRRSKCISLYEETPWKEQPQRRSSAEDADDSPTSPMSKVLARLNVADVPADTLAALATSTVASAESDDNLSRPRDHHNSSGYDTLDSVATTSSTGSDDSDAVCVVTGIPSLSIGTSSYMQTDV